MTRLFFALALVGVLSLGACGKETSSKTEVAQNYAGAAPAPAPAPAPEPEPEPAPVERSCQSGHGLPSQFCCSDENGNFCRENYTCNPRSLICN